MALAGTLTTTHLTEAPDPLIAVVPLGPSTESENSAAAVAVDGRTGRTFAAGSGPTMSQITMLDTTTGAVVRTITAGPVVQGIVESIDVDEARGHALVLTDPDTIGQGQGPPGRVSVLDARDGRVLHSAVLGPDSRPVALDQKRGHFFALTTDANGRGRIAMVDTATGRVLRTVAIAAGAGNYEGLSGVALDATRGRLFVTTVGVDFVVYVSALDTRSGAVVRSVALGSAIQGGGEIAMDERTERVFVASDNRVRVLDARDGRTLRTVVAATTVISVVDDARTEHVFVLAGRNILTLDARSGAVVGRTRPPGLAGGVLTDIAQTGRVFLTNPAGGNGSLLNVLDTATGAIVSTIGGDGSKVGLVRAVDGRRGRVFETVSGPDKDGADTGSGSVIVRDGRSGLVRQTVQVGHDPVETVVDPQTGAAFVLDRADDTLTVLAPNVGATAPAALSNPLQPAHPAKSFLPRTLPFTGYAAVVDERTSRAFISGKRVTGVTRTAAGTLPQIVGSVRVVDTATGALLRVVDVGGVPGGPGAVRRRGPLERLRRGLRSWQGGQQRAIERHPAHKRVGPGGSAVPPG